MGTKGIDPAHAFWLAIPAWKTCEVKVGSLSIGGNAPLRIQSMTNTDTRQVDRTLEQVLQLASAGCELVRCTTQGKKELDALAKVRRLLRDEGIKTPLAADVHYLPSLALEAAGKVDKVRINPGNYGIGPATRNLSPEEIRKIQEKHFTALIAACRESGTALRIGVNHGSLSERIMQAYGDTPEGMAESAMEFLRICRKMNFEHVVVSMKSSNTRVMVYATRLLLWKMMQEDMHFPLHLGVTEAGEGEDGRLKSAVGIASLLADGIGDTIRVSLTEDPVAEIPVARKIARYSLRPPVQSIAGRQAMPFEYRRRKSIPCLGVGGDHPPVVVTSILPENSVKETFADFVVLEGKVDGNQGSGSNPEKTAGKTIIPLNSGNHEYRLYRAGQDTFPEEPSVTPYFLEISSPAQLKALPENSVHNSRTILVLNLTGNHPENMPAECFSILAERGWEVPVILKKVYTEGNGEDLFIRAACELGPSCLDGLADGLWVEATDASLLGTAGSLAAGILQASRLRMFRTEYISCPSCGRTLFDIRGTSARVKERTAHLKNLKIAVMGCMVNGPGEMADADYGYIGSGPGKVNLYRHKTLVKRNVPQDEAIDELIGLIKKEGDWTEPAV